MSNEQALRALIDEARPFASGAVLNSVEPDSLLLSRACGLIAKMQRRLSADYMERRLRALTAHARPVDEDRLGPLLVDSCVARYIPDRQFGNRYGIDWIYHDDARGVLSEREAFAEKSARATPAAVDALPYAYACPARCGCLWRLNPDEGDGLSLSLFGPNSKPCAVCEPLGLADMIALATLQPAQATPAAVDALRELDRLDDGIYYVKRDFGRHQRVEISTIHGEPRHAKPDAPHFNSSNDLATWLESLHECTAAGSVTNRPWSAAQRAALAVRGDLPVETAAREVEAWWVEQGQHLLDGAPACIFNLRRAIAAPRAQDTAPRGGGEADDREWRRLGESDERSEAVARFDLEVAPPAAQASDTGRGEAVGHD